VDVRIIASTNQHIRKKMKSAQFREDFFYRLNVLPIHLPSLREHPEDIPLIASHLLEKHCAKLNKPLKRLSSELLEIFLNRPWEGNVREMENMIMQGILFSSSDEIKPQDLGLVEHARNDGLVDSSLQDLPYKAAKEQTLMQFNSSYINNVLSKCNGNVTQAARLCKLERQALQQIMRRYEIKAEPFRKKPDAKKK
jgi:DNA-binding NtrC family response regulator